MEGGKMERDQRERQGEWENEEVTTVESNKIKI